MNAFRKKIVDGLFTNFISERIIQKFTDVEKKERKKERRSFTLDLINQQHTERKRRNEKNTTDFPFLFRD